jgi:hypothetical protein
MPSLTPERLRKLALDALEEVVAEAEHRPVRRTWATRFALIYLSYEAPKGRAGEPYRDFWRCMSIVDQHRRSGALKEALGIMYSYADEKRDPERVLFFTEQAKSMDV